MTREESIKIIKSIKRFIYQPEWNAALNIAIEALQEPERKWILVSERLPECEGIYLITSKVFDKAEVQYVFYQKNIEMFICNGTAIAWQPLPEPYKAGEQE